MSMPKQRLLFAGLSFLILFLYCCITICEAQINSSCVPSSCGDITIRYPFRLKDEPKNCGHPDPLFTLDCQKNQTVLTSRPHRYNVLAINYDNFTIRIADPGLDRNNYSSCPIYSEYYDVSSSYMYISSIQSISLVNCLSPVNNSLYIENPFCGNQSAFSNSSKIYSYFVVGSILVSDIEESCTFEKVLQASSATPLQQLTTYSAIHDFLLSGAEFTWFRATAICGECDATKATCVFEDNQIRCRHYCYESTPLSERTFGCKLEYYAPYIFFIGLPVIGALLLLCVLIVIIRSIKRRRRRRQASIHDETDKDTNPPSCSPNQTHDSV